MKISISPARPRSGFTNQFLAVSFSNDDGTPVVSYSAIIGSAYVREGKADVPGALENASSDANETAAEYLDRFNNPKEAANCNEKARLLRVASLYAMCDSADGIKAMLAKLETLNMLWNFDDSAATIEWNNYYPLPREVEALEALREIALNMCDVYGVDIFTLYPGYEETPLVTEAECDKWLHDAGFPCPVTGKAIPADSVATDPARPYSFNVCGACAECHPEPSDTVDPATLARVRELATIWSDHMGDEGVPHPHAVTFPFEGMDICNPFISECGRFDVDPVETYGKDTFQLWASAAALRLSSK
jgi:hypothetical protein